METIRTISLRVALLINSTYLARKIAPEKKVINTGKVSFVVFKKVTNKPSASEMAIRRIVIILPIPNLPILINAKAAVIIVIIA